MPTRPGTPERPLRVAVVGAGPSGFYTAAALLAAPDLAVSIDLFDRLPAPHGLVRYGVAPDHPKIKAVSRVFDKLALDPRLRFLGNVEVGRDLRHGDLRRHYDQVVYAVGGQSDRQLGVPGEELPGSYSSTEFVAWYSSHPDFIDLEPSLECEEAAVVGIGNVAMDVARVLVRDPDELAVTDIADVALDALRESRVRTVHVLARRGAVQAKCSPPGLKELGEMAGVDVVVDPAELEIDEASAAELAEDRQAQKNLELLRTFAERGPTGRPRRIHLRFLVSPVEMVERDGRVGGLRLERNRLEPTAGGGTRAVGTGEFETLPVGMGIRLVLPRSMADRREKIREPGDIAAARQEFAEAADEDHHRQRHQDRVRPGVGDDRAHHQAGQGADADREQRTDEEDADAGIKPAVGAEVPGEGQPADVGGEGDGEVEPARNDRHQHRQA